MNVLLGNILLAMIWMVITGSFKPVSFAAGFLFSYLILWLLRGAIFPGSTYFSKVRQVIGFSGFFIKELIMANLKVAHDVLTLRHHMRPGVVAIPLDVETDAEITTLANLITLTPGTLSLDVSSDRRVLYVHCMYLDDTRGFRRAIKDGFERRVMELLR
ncbi:MAG: Na+/H+ antiporter subunit E [Syntrophobacteraceae bacterium]|jgi:multicomponent Na+:H+ antiporter subunit E|nr:Na+/H+ antiporter subunit E [Syntrophobacteraceae bacterium]